MTNDMLPVGFTHEDVAALRRSADDAERWLAEHGWATRDSDEHLKRTRSVADRIAALLPPES